MADDATLGPDDPGAWHDNRAEQQSDLSFMYQPETTPLRLANITVYRMQWRSQPFERDGAIRIFAELVTYNNLEN